MVLHLAVLGKATCSSRDDTIFSETTCRLLANYRFGRARARWRDTALVMRHFCSFQSERHHCSVSSSRFKLILLTLTETTDRHFPTVVVEIETSFPTRAFVRARCEIVGLEEEAEGSVMRDCVKSQSRRAACWEWFCSREWNRRRQGCQ